MTTSMRTYTGAFAIQCDRCDLRFSTDFSAGDVQWRVARAFHAACAAQGWTFYASRSLRTYCPDCGPSKGHRMKNVTASYAKGGDES